MIAQLKEDKLEADRKLIRIPLSTVRRKLGGNNEDINILDEHLITGLKSNSTTSKDFNSETPTIGTTIIKEINKGQRERCDHP